MNGFLYDSITVDSQIPNPDIDQQKVCIYGPWVREKLHNNRPEIHPMELIWFNYKGDLHLTVSQDASKRFHKKGKYKGDKSSPWKPWAKSSITGIFRLPFEIDLTATDTLSFTLSSVQTKHVQSNPGYADTFAIHQFKVDTTVRVIVEKPVTNKNEIGIEFVDFCQPTPDKLRGFLKINMQVGKDDDFGFYTLKVEKNNGLSANLSLLKQQKKRPSSILPKPKVSLASFQQQQQEPEKELPFELIPRPTNLNQFPVAASPNTIAMFKELNGIRARSQSQIIAYENIDFSVHPYYCPSEGEGCEPIIGAEYKKVIAKYIEDFGVDTSNVRITWSFRGLNLSTGKTVQVDTVRDDRSEIWALPRSFNRKNDGLSIRFYLAKQALYRLEATAFMVDKQGNTGQETFVFDSHAIDKRNALEEAQGTTLLKKLTEDLGYSFEALFAERLTQRKAGIPYATYLEGSKVRPNIQEIKYQMVLNFYEQMTFDETITDSEIRILKRLIQATQGNITEKNR